MRSACRLAVSIFLLCSALTTVALVPTWAGLPLTGPVPRFVAPVVEAPPTLDGKLDDACWRKALTSDEFYPMEAGAAQDQPSRATTLYLARQGRKLLVGLECRAVAGKSGTESVLILLDTMHVHELSHSVTVKSDGTSAPSAWWDPAWAKLPDHYQAAVVAGETGWSAEVAIDLTRFPYARSHQEDIGCFVARQFADKTRLAWALPSVSTSILTESWDPYLARHLAGLDLPVMWGEMEAENDATFAPLAPRAERVHQQVGALLGEARLPAAARLKAAALAAYAEEAKPRTRECVERIAVRGLAERETYLRDAEALAEALADRPAEGTASALLSRLGGLQSPAYWEMDGTRSLGRSRGRNYNLAIMRYGLPLAGVEEREVLAPLNIDRTCSGIEESLRKQGVEVTHEARSPFEVCVADLPTSGPSIPYARRDFYLYSAEAAMPGGESLVMEALVAQQPFDDELAKRVWSRFPTPVRVEEVEGLLAFPLAEAVLVIPREVGQRNDKLAGALQLALGGVKGVAGAEPAEGPMVVVGLAGQEGALEAAGLSRATWAGEGRVARQQIAGRNVVGLWGRDEAGLERAARVFADVRRLLTGRELLIGDLHMHTMLSDGSGSARQVLLACLAAGMDFAAITDHYRGGASYQAKDWCSRWIPSFTAIRGLEVMGADFEILALGISRDIETQPDPQRIAAQIHAQGGTALLCHPYGPPYTRILERLEAVGLDGIDRYTGPMAGYLAQRELVGRQPVVTAVTDSHTLSFVQPYRTLVFAADRSEQGILSAIREGWYVTLDNRGISGAPRLADVMLALIGEERYLEARYERNAQARVEELLRAWREGGLQ